MRSATFIQLAIDFLDVPASLLGFRGRRRRPATAYRAAGFFLPLARQFAVVLAHPLKNLLIHILQVQQAVAGLGYPDQLVKFDLQRRRVPVLAVLDQEYHQKRHDRGARIDHQLPRVPIMEQGPGSPPYHHDGRRDQERHRLAGMACGGFGKTTERLR